MIELQKYGTIGSWGKMECLTAGLYIVPYSPPPGGNEGFGEGEEKGRSKKREKKKKTWGKYNFWQ